MFGNQDRGNNEEEPQGARNLLRTIHAELFNVPDGFDKRGETGAPVTVLSNFVPLTLDKDKKINQYHVDFVPAVDAKYFRYLLMKNELVREELGDDFVFDGMILYTTKEYLKEQSIEVMHPMKQEPVVIKLRLSVSFKTNDPQFINLVNILFKRCFEKCGLKALGRNYFDMSESHVVEGYPMKIFGGYEAAVRTYQNGMLLCIENRFKFIRSDSVLDLMEKERNAVRDIESFQAKFAEQYYGETIVTRYNNRLFRMSRVDWDINVSEFEFKKANDERISLLDYVRDEHGIVLKDRLQPVIVSEGKPKQPGEPNQLTFLAPELCNPTGLTEDMRKDTRMMRLVSSVTRLNPTQRYERTQRLLRKIYAHPECVSLLSAWGLNLGTDIVKIPARVLAPERLFGGKAIGYVGQKAEWARDTKTQGNYRSKDLLQWLFVSPNQQKHMIAAKSFVEECKQLGKQMNMKVEEPMFVTMDNQVDAAGYCSSIKKVLNKIGDEEVDILVVLLDDDNKTRYDSIKKLVCCEIPVVSQCIQLRTLRARDGQLNKNFRSIVLKILLQMNCKMGGALWRVNIPMKNAMIVGYDLYHDSTCRGKTIGACVSTMDSSFTEFFSQTRPHENPTQLGDNLRDFICKSLRQYYLRNERTLPDKMIIYRDGAGDGQIPYIRDHEVSLVEQACAEVCKKAKMPEHVIKFAFIVVTKKVTMRVFMPAPGGSSLKNAEPGTVVDDVVTRPERYDFYLVPQFVNEGTVTPVCYQVLHDSTGLKPDKHHQLAYKLCHMYYNWQGTVRVPAPVQYAHKLATLTAQSIHQSADAKIRNRLFFL